MSHAILERQAEPEPAAPTAWTSDRFDPQDLVATIPAKWHRARWFWLFGVLAATSLILVNVYQGTIGSVSDFQLLDDLRRIFGFTGVPDSEPAFPLIRDVPSWILLTAISVSLVLLRHEWNRMAKCLPQLVSKGVLRPNGVVYKNGQLDVIATYGKHRLIPDWLFRLPGTPQPHAHRSEIEENSLTVFLGAVQANANRLRSPVTITILLISFGLAVTLSSWQRSGNLFAKIAPPNLTGQPRQDWLHATYTDWWASNDHLPGNGLYFLAAFVAFTVVLSFITGGLYSIYVGAALKYACGRRASWADEDSDFGWRPLGKVYRTVWQALLLLSFSIAVIGSVLGFTLSSPVGFLILVGIFSIPLFIIAPGIIFHGAVEEAKAAEANPLRQAVGAIDRELLHLRMARSNGIGLSEALEEVQYQSNRKVLLDELDRINAAKIKPLRLIPKTLLLVLIPQAIVLLGLIFGAIQAFK